MLNTFSWAGQDHILIHLLLNSNKNLKVTLIVLDISSQIDELSFFKRLIISLRQLVFVIATWVLFEQNSIIEYFPSICLLDPGFIEADLLKSYWSLLFQDLYYSDILKGLSYFFIVKVNFKALESWTRTIMLFDLFIFLVFEFIIKSFTIH